MTNQDCTAKLLLEALVYVERVAATAPTEPRRIKKQREASQLAAKIRAALSSQSEAA